MLRLHT